jgi:hypothetical protein
MNTLVEAQLAVFVKSMKLFIHADLNNPQVSQLLALK